MCSADCIEHCGQERSNALLPMLCANCTEHNGQDMKMSSADCCTEQDGQDMLMLDDVPGVLVDAIHMLEEEMVCC